MMTLDPKKRKKKKEKKLHQGVIFFDKPSRCNETNMYINSLLKSRKKKEKEKRYFCPLIMARGKQKKK